MFKTIIEFSLMLSLVSLMLGCGGGPPAPKVPKIDAAASATAAMADYDTNKDGFIDALLGGNDHDISTQLGRLDASHGLLLINDKTGSFSIVSLSIVLICSLVKIFIL